MDVIFLTTEDVLRIHENQISLYGGEATVRDQSLMESAAETPRASFDGEYPHGDTFEMAAAYWYHIVQNHPFVDGNKRTGTAAALVFLDMNGVEVEADEMSVADLTIAVATGRASKSAVADFLRTHADPKR